MVTSQAFLYIITFSHSHQWFSEIFQLGFMRRLLTVLKKWNTWIMDLTRFSGNEAEKIHFLMHFLLPLKKMTRIFTLER